MNALLATIGGSISSLLPGYRRNGPAQERRVIAEIGRTVSRPFGAAEVFESFAGLVNEVVQHDRIVITFADPEGGTFKIAHVLGTAVSGMEQGDVISLEDSFVAEVVRLGNTIRFNPSDQYRHNLRFERVDLVSRIGTPLRLNDQVIGTLQLASKKPNAYGEPDLPRMERIGHQISNAVACEFFLESARSRAGQLNGMYQVAAALAKAQSFEEKTQEIMDTLALVSMADFAVLWSGNHGTDRLRLVATAGLGVIDVETSPSKGRGSASGRAFSQRTTVVINDYRNFSDATPSALDLGIRSVFATPIRSGAGTEGLLSVGSKVLNHFNAERVALLTALADAIAPIFESAELSESLQASREEIALVDEVARIVTATLDIQDVYERFAEEIKKLVDFDRITILAIDQDTQVVTVKYTFGDKIPGRNVGDVVHFTESGPYSVSNLGVPNFRGDLMNRAGSRNPVDEAYAALGFCSSAVAPLMSRGRLIGAMGLRSRRAEAFGPREQAIILRLADQIAPAIENAILYEQSLESQETQRRLAGENAVMAEIGRIIASPFSDDDVYRRFAEAVQTLVGFDRITITVVDSSGGNTSSQYILGTDVSGWEQGVVKIMDGACVPFITKIQSSDVPLILNPGDVDDLQESYPTLMDFYRAGLRSFMGCRLMTNGRVIGTLQLASSTKGHYGRHESQLLERIANQVAGSIASAMALQVERDRVGQMEALYEVAAIVAQPMSFEAKAQGIVEALVQIGDADHVMVRRADEDGNNLKLVAHAGSRPGGFDSSLSMSDQFSLSAEAFREGRILVIIDYQKDPGAMDSMLTQSVEYILVMPIKARGRALGLLSVTSKIANHFNRQRVALLTAFADEIGIVFDTAELTQIIQESEKEMALADETANIAASITDFEDLGKKLTTELRKLVEFDVAILATFDQESSMATIRYSLGPEISGREVGDRVPMDRSGNMAALADGRPSIGADPLEDAKNRQDEVYLAHGLSSSAVAPLISKGQVVGSIALSSYRPGAYGPKEQVIITRLAKQIAPALENAVLLEQKLDSQRAQRRLTAELAAKKEEMALVDHIAGIIISNTDIDDVYSHFADELKKLIDFDRIVVNHIDRRLGRFKTRFVSGVHVNGREEGTEHKLRGTATGRLVQAGRPFVREDLRAGKITRSDNLFIAAGLRSSIAFLLVSNSGIVASLHVHSKQTAAFGSRERIILERLAVQIAPAIANALLNDALVRGEARNQALLETTSDGIIAIDETGVIQSFNPSAEAMFGYSADEMMGRNVSVLMSERDKGRNNEFLSPYLTTRETQIIGGAGRVLEARRKDGATFPMELWVGVVKTDQGRGFIGIIRKLEQQAEKGEAEPHQDRNGQPSDLAGPRLTNREIEVLHLLAGGGRNKDVAAEMTVSLHTVRFHIENLYAKLEVRTRGQLIRVATRLGLLRI